MEQDTKAVIQQKFRHLEDALVTEISQESTIRQLAEGENVLQTGQFIRSTILVSDGLLKVYREDEEGNEFLMYYLQPGDACALSIMCTVRNDQSGIKARAVIPSEVILVPAHLTENWLSKYKTWNHFVISSYRQRFEELLQTLDSVAFKALDERLLFYLKRYQQVQGHEVKLSHQQIADELNSSREVISRLLKKLEQRGALQLHRNYIEIIDLDSN
ncbi:Crp/Fnr family transcriptional regulator [Adhaeribacter rhizoryzae]|uniref:Crp/Fnr family transcriptional regulator n=1 Tax=Adhaeribacter rhizoryzae TaxID=2607907 RepID=A0A5M6DJX4_9BACT|nr:Crp/Fnr family transcriptional regulator [Adhaeribacter rhizoryzae]KAA5547844.1 Crp/Fnr family transcriptional regulator [Adhaeribacter rhizoryzae]